MQKKLSYCGELMRQHDPDRFLLSLFAPSQHQDALWTLFAFNHEIAKTREVVSEPMLGQIRLQWWRDALAGIYDGDKILEHEVVEPLAAVIKSHELPREKLEALIDARERDLMAQPYNDTQTLLDYIDQTSIPLIELALSVIGAQEDEGVTAKIARNYAFVGLVRAIPYNNYDHADLIIDTAKKHFDASARARSRFLNVFQSFSSIYMKKLDKIDFDPQSPRFYTPPAMLALRLVVKNGLK